MTSVVRGNVQRASLSGQVARLLEQYLDDNQFAPGDALPPTKDLARQFDVSIPVVREAIAELAGRGRLQRSQGRPTVARTPSATELQSVLGSTLPLGTERDRQALDLRRGLRVGAVRTASQRCGPPDIDRLHGQLDDWDSLPLDPEQLRRAELTFHRSIAELAGNDLILLTSDAVDALLIDVDIATWQRRLRDPDAVSRTAERLGTVVAAMLAKRPRRAEKLMHDHLDRQDP